MARVRLGWLAALFLWLCVAEGTEWNDILISNPQKQHVRMTPEIISAYSEKIDRNKKEEIANKDIKNTKLKENRLDNNELDETFEQTTPFIPDTGNYQSDQPYYTHAARKGQFYEDKRLNNIEPQQTKDPVAPYWEIASALSQNRTRNSEPKTKWRHHKRRKVHKPKHRRYKTHIPGQSRHHKSSHSYRKNYHYKNLLGKHDKEKRPHNDRSSQDDRNRHYDNGNMNINKNGYEYNTDHGDGGKSYNYFRTGNDKTDSRRDLCNQNKRREHKDRHTTRFDNQYNGDDSCNDQNENYNRNRKYDRYSRYGNNKNKRNGEKETTWQNFKRKGGHYLRKIKNNVQGAFGY